jgi:hypothetical protein
MQPNMPDFRKYFPNCQVPQVGAPVAHGSGTRAAEPPLPQAPLRDARVVPCWGLKNEPVDKVIGSPTPRLSNKPLAGGTRVLRLTRSKQLLIYLCVLGWSAAGVVFSLWLVR